MENRHWSIGLVRTQRTGTSPRRRLSSSPGHTFFALTFLPPIHAFKPVLTPLYTLARFP